MSHEGFHPLNPTERTVAVPSTVPFVAPEELARTTGQTGLLRLGANESSYGPAPAALEAMRAAAADVWMYGDPECYELRQALAAKHGCAVEEVIVGSGIDDLLGMLVRAYLGEDEVAVTTSGSYPTFAYHVVGYGSRTETVRYGDTGRVQIDLLLEAVRKTHARLVYLANPDNPSGSFAARDEVDALVELLPSQTLLVLDEAYADFVPERELMAATIDPRVVRMRTFSKAYGLAGARIGYALGSRGLVSTFQKLRLHFGVNRVAQVGALASMSDDAHVRTVVADVERGRGEYAELAERLGLWTLPSRTNFVLFDLGTRARAEELVRALLRRGVFIRKPAAPPLDRCVRISVGTAAERARLAEAMGEALAETDAKMEHPARS